ncbi:MAG: hypothetical protein EA422_07525 [Gemmatimonadales bacterium]|nr:MAG: hypothetical protein EA422_07525 [Gemmatimonadales bacterium]
MGTSFRSRALAVIRGGSLDAVAVLLAGQWAVTAWVGVPLPPEAMFFLAVGIWLGYTADRMADVERAPELVRRTARHAFHGRHRGPLLVLWVIAFVGSWPAAFVFLPGRAVALGAALTTAAALYVAWARRSPDGAGKTVATVLLLTASVVWWPLAAGPGMASGWWTDPGGWPAPGGWMAAAFFAVGATWNLRTLRRVRRGGGGGNGRRRGEPVGTPSGEGPEVERAALRADGLLLVALLLLGFAAP